MNGDFWAALDALVAQSRVVIDRPRGSAHPRNPHVVYPLDYGYLDGTSTMDGAGIDVWRGSDASRGLCALVVTVDLIKRDSEIKLLLDCTEDEVRAVMAFHSDSDFMKAMLVRRG